jgi:hypothetical protein
MGARVRHCQPDTKRGPQCPWLVMWYLVTFYTGTTSHERVSDFFPRISDIRNVLNQTICKVLISKNWLQTKAQMNTFSERMGDITYMTRNRCSIRAPRSVVLLVSDNCPILSVDSSPMFCRKEKYGFMKTYRKCLNAI